VDFILSLELLTLIIIVWLSQFIEIAGIGFSTTGKTVCLQDFQEIAPTPSRNTYPLVA
jgi:hypothetical protein